MGPRSARQLERPAFLRLALLLAILPVLIIGPALGGMAAWLHAHGQLGRHLHVLLVDHAHTHSASLDLRHADWHRHSEDEGKNQDDEPAPAGFLIELPQLLAAPAAGRICFAGSSLGGSLGLTALPPVAHGQLNATASPERHRPSRSGWPPQRTSRTGVAALLRSSHAILI